MAFSDEDKEKANRMSNEIIGAAIEVHRHLGPGLLESTYDVCLQREFEVRGLSFEYQKCLPIEYKGRKIEGAFRVDFLVGQSVIVESKSVIEFHPIHEAQLLTYLRLTNLWLGLLINFNVRMLKNGINRVVLG